MSIIIMVLSEYMFVIIHDPSSFTEIGYNLGLLQSVFHFYG